MSGPTATQVGRLQAGDVLPHATCVCPAQHGACTATLVTVSKLLAGLSVLAPPCPVVPMQTAAYTSLIPPYLLLPAAVGAVPLRWYKDEDHIGYDLEGKKIIKKQKADALDRLLDRNDSKQVRCPGARVCNGVRDICWAGHV